MQIDDSTVRWAIVTFGGGMLTLLAATWRSARLSRDAEKKLEMAESHEKEIYGDQKANPPIKGLKAELIEARNLIDSWKNSVKALLRAHDASGGSDEHRIEADVRRYHESFLEAQARAERGDRQSTPAYEGSGYHENPNDPETTQQRRQRLHAEQNERFNVRERAELHTDARGTPLLPAHYEEVSDPFSGEDPPPPAQARNRLPTPYRSEHARVSPQPPRKRRDDDKDR